MKNKKKKALLAVTVLIIIMVAVRLYLPIWTKNKINSALEDAGKYTGSISDVDMHIYRGAYKIANLTFKNKENLEAQPLIHIPSSDISIEWKSLLEGALVGEIIFDSLSANIVSGENNGTDQTGMETDWTQIVTRLIPIKLNRVSVQDGAVNININGENTVINHLQCDLENLRNVIQPDSVLPSTLSITAHAQNFSGDIVINGRANFIDTEIPNFDYDAQIENIDFTSTESIVDQVLPITIEEGTLNIYNEIAHRGETIDGYIKTTLKDAKIFKWKEEDRTFLESLGEAVAQLGIELFENEKEDQVATKLPISGSFQNTEANYWVAFITLIKNAFWKSLKNEVDNTINYTSTNTES